MDATISIKSILEGVWGFLQNILFEFGLVYGLIIIGAIYIIVRTILSRVGRDTAIAISAIPTLIIVYCALRWVGII